MKTFKLSVNACKVARIDDEMHSEMINWIEDNFEKFGDQIVTYAGLVGNQDLLSLEIE